MPTAKVSASRHLHLRYTPAHRADRRHRLRVRPVRSAVRRSGGPLGNDRAHARDRALVRPRGRRSPAAAGCGSTTSPSSRSGSCRGRSSAAGSGSRSSTGRSTVADPGVLIDPSVGGLDLGLAVVGGTLSGSYVASLLGAPLGRWLHLAAAPALFVIGAGKLSMVLTGAGQGTPSDERWATAYAGPGPWGSVAPAIPSNPSQAYEGIATLAILAVLAVLLMVGAFRRRDGRLFYLAIGLWALARAGGLDDLARPGSGRRSAGRGHHRGRDRRRVRDPVRRDHHRQRGARYGPRLGGASGRHRGAGRRDSRRRTPNRVLRSEAWASRAGTGEYRGATPSFPTA